uniref:Uncharacterized protein n=1 Tax=Spermophilus dauricus TaxID=99837 RepID=A0A8C9P372_SPEDA
RNSGMDSDILQRELTCSICMNYLIDPVTICCGHSFCWPCLCLLWEEAQTPAHCPMCREPSQQIDFKSNIRLKNLVSIVRKASVRHFPSPKDHMCVTHKERKIFCEENKTLLCLLCSNSQEHRAHRHCAIEEAAEQYREKFVKLMRSLWKKIQENQRNLKEEKRSIYLFIFFPCRYELVFLHMPQPVRPQLSAQPITGLRDELNHFQGGCQSV